jgi:hypothetical protein
MAAMDPRPKPSRDSQAKIFINYRREDTAGHAGRLLDRLAPHFPGRVFMDIDTLQPGVDFVEAIEQAVGSCEVLLVLIGREWLAADAAGRKRLDDPNDFVRLEVATALKRDIRLIPVLVQSASMPRAEELPPDLAKLARRNAIELSDALWAYDVERLVKAIESVPATTESGGAQPTRTAAEPREPSSTESRRAGRKKVWIALAATAIVVAVGGSLLWLSGLRKGPAGAVGEEAAPTGEDQPGERRADVVAPEDQTANALGSGVDLGTGVDQPTSDFVAGSSRVFSADFASWPRTDTEYGSVGLAFGNSYFLEPTTNTWIGPGHLLEIPELAGDFVLDVRFRIERRNPSASLHLTLVGEGPDADAVDAFLDVWDQDNVTYTLAKGRVRSGGGLGVPHAVTDETFAEREQVPPTVKAHDWSMGSKLTLKREAGRMQFFVNDNFVREFSVPRFPIRKLGVAAAFDSMIVLTSVEARSPAS